MSSEWEEYIFEDCLETLIDYRGKTPEKAERGIPLITAKIVKNGKIEKPSEFIAESDYASWMRRGIPQYGDIIMTTEAPLGEVAQLGNGKFALAQRIITLRGKKDVLDNAFLLYLIQTKEMQNKLKARATGTTVLGIKQSELRKIPVQLPPISFQKTIVSILKALDDRIHLLRETNATLEAIAQALFKSWFVDFDPVHAKVEGRAPEGMDADTAALFPDSFKESELGMIPEGWKVSRVESHIELAYGKALKQENRIAGSIIVMGSNGQIGVHNELLVKGPGIVIGRKGNPGTVEWVDSDFFPIDTTFYLRQKDDIPLAFWLYTFSALSLPSLAADSAVPGLNRNFVYNCAFSHPPLDILLVFNAFFETIRANIYSNTKRIETLSILRDTLIPRLISGKLRLPEFAESASGTVL